MSVRTLWDDGASSVVGEPNLRSTPKIYPKDHTRTGAVWSHRAWGPQTFGTPETDLIDFAFSSYKGLNAAICDAGLPMIATREGGGTTWANDVALAAVDAAVLALHDEMGAKTDKVVLMGYSMGGACSMAWARAHPDRVACMALINPVSDINDIWIGPPAGRGSLAPGIDAAYGGTWSNATYGALHNPVLFASQLSGIPMQIWYSLDDTIVRPFTVENVIAQHGNVDVHTMNGIHTDMTDLSVSRFAAFIRDNS